MVKKDPDAKLVWGVVHPGEARMEFVVDEGASEVARAPPRELRQGSGGAAPGKFWVFYVLSARRYCNLAPITLKIRDN